MKLMVTLALIQASEASAYLAPMAKLKRNKHDLTNQYPKKVSNDEVARALPVSSRAAGSEGDAGLKGGRVLQVDSSSKLLKMIRNEISSMSCL